MTVYASIGANRIQTWLARTPKLTHLRGASKALHGGRYDDSGARTGKTPRHGYTSAGYVDPLLRAWFPTGSVVRDPDAGERDGVVVLRGESEADTSRATRRLLDELRKRLPGLEWQAWWVEADDLIHATSLERAGDPRVRRVSFGSLSLDFPLALQCRQCRSEPRVPTQDEGVDCAARKEFADAFDLTDEFFEGPMDRLATRGGKTADGVVGRRQSTNHVATVRADGNRIGSLFTRMDRSPLHLPRLRRSAVGDLNTATADAVNAGLNATNWARGGAANGSGVLVHYVGGDDVLVSVAAPLAWEFVTALVHRFEQLRSRWRSQLVLDLQEPTNAALDAGVVDREGADLASLIDKVSLGVGLVFAHRSHPFADAWEVAGEAEHAAKVNTQGEASAIAWIDLSAEAMTDVRPHETWLQVQTAEQVSIQLYDPRFPEGSDDQVRRRRAFQEVVDMPSSGRHQLMAVIRDHADSDPAGAAVAWAERLNYPEVKAMALAGGVTELSSIVSQVRWWPAAAPVAAQFNGRESEAAR